MAGNVTTTERWTTDHVRVLDAKGQRVAKLERSSEDGELIAAAPWLRDAGIAMVIAYISKRDEPGSYAEQQLAFAEMAAALKAAGTEI